MRNQYRILQTRKKVITFFFIIIFMTQIAVIADHSNLARANTQTTSVQLNPKAGLATGIFNSSKQATFISVANGTSISYSVAVGVVGGGVVSINPNETEYTAGSNITITAVPENGWSFAGWSGDLTGDANPASMIVEGNITVIANFVQNILSSTYAMTFTEHGLPLDTLWGVTVKPQGIFFVLSHGQTAFSKSNTVTLNVPPGNYAWNASALIYVGTGTRYLALGDSGTADVISQISQNVSYGIQFAVSLAVNPANGGLTSPSNLTVWEDSGKSLAISAVPNSGYTFSSWTTNSSLVTVNDPSSASTVATINGAGTIVADFLSLSSPTTSPTLTLAPSPTPTPTSTPTATPSQTSTPISTQTPVATQTPAPSLTPAPAGSGLPIVVLVAILAAGIILAVVAAILLARKRRG